MDKTFELGNYCFSSFTALPTFTKTIICIGAFIKMTLIRLNYR